MCDGRSSAKENMWAGFAITIGCGGRLTVPLISTRGLGPMPTILGSHGVLPYRHGDGLAPALVLVRGQRAAAIPHTTNVPQACVRSRAHVLVRAHHTSDSRAGERTTFRRSTSLGWWHCG